MAWIYLAASGDSLSRSRLGSDPSPTVKTTDTHKLFYCPACRAVIFLPRQSGMTCARCEVNWSTSLVSTSFTAAFPAKTSARQAMVAERGFGAQDLGYGERCIDSSKKYNRQTSSLKTWVDGKRGCLQCGRPLIKSTTTRCRWKCPPLKSDFRLKEREFLLPRPTATANQLCPSMKKWRSCANLQKLIGQSGGMPQPEVWEWLMGYRSKWSDLEPWATQWYRSKRGKRSKD